MEIVIIGNGPAAISALEAIRELDRDSRITLISREYEPFYSPCPLAEYIEGSVSREQLFLRDEDFYSRLKVTTRFGWEVTRVDTTARKVVAVPVVKTGAYEEVRIPYERLLIATGARAVLPPIPGLRRGKEGLFVLKTLADAEAIRTYLKAAQQAVVIGAGFIGLEAAQALARQGLSVTVVEALDHVLPQMLDAEMAGHVQAHLERHDVRVMVGAPVEAVLGDGRVHGVVAGGQELPCDLVICAVGVRPDLSLVQGTGIATHLGILVDEHMQTSQPGVFAAGDVIETADIFGEPQVLPTWPNAMASGRVAGANMVGVPRRFTGLVNANVLRVFDLPVVSLGRRDGERVLRWERDGVVKKATLQGNRLVGLQMIGQVDGAGIFLELIKKGREVTEFGADLLAPDFNYGRLIHPVFRNGKGYAGLSALRGFA
jgi:NAD(P)H-nitrite reductase large subunit